MISVGDPAPDFKLPSHLEKDISLGELLEEGKSVIVYFYPSNYTPMCVTEACAFRDSYKLFSSLGIEIIGISPDQVTAQMSFADKLEIPFILLSDPKCTVADLYGIEKVFGFIQSRTTLIVGSDGIVQHMFTNQLDGAGHVQSALEHMKILDVINEKIKEVEES